MGWWLQSDLGVLQAPARPGVQEAPVRPGVRRAPVRPEVREAPALRNNKADSSLAKPACSYYYSYNLSNIYVKCCHMDHYKTL